MNKNIAQLRWCCGLPTQDLRATLPNLLVLLQGNTDYRYDRPDSGLSSIRYVTSTDLQSEPAQSMGKKYGSFPTLEPSLTSSNDRMHLSNSISNSCEQIFTAHARNDSTQNSTPVRRISRSILSESGPGLSQILTAPGNCFKVIGNTSTPQQFKLDAPIETKQQNENCLPTIMNEAENDRIQNAETEQCDTGNVSEKSKDAMTSSSCVDCNIEQGLDILDSPNTVCSTQNEHSLKVDAKITAEMNGTDPLDLANKLKCRISRSVGSYPEEQHTLTRSNLEIGSDPLLINSADNPENNLSDQSLPNSLGEGRKEFLQHWFNSSPALVYSDEHLCPEEFLGTTGQASGDEIIGENALTIRTDALVETNSTFHLVKPKH